MFSRKWLFGVNFGFLNLMLLALAQAQPDFEKFSEDFDTPPLLQTCLDELASPAQQQACSQAKLAAFIQENLRYPPAALAQQTQGLALVQILLNEQGEMVYTALSQDPGQGCGSEALRICRQLPPFSPAKKQGQAIAAKLYLPIRFEIQQLPHPLDQNELQLDWPPYPQDSLNHKTLKKQSKNLQIPFFVRDQQGETYPIQNLSLTWIRGRKVREIQNQGPQLNPKALRWLKKPKPKTYLVIRAQIPYGQGIAEVLREWSIY